MISAKEALQLPTAQLSEKELEDANKLEAEIEGHVKTSMKRHGCDIAVAITNLGIIAEMNQRLKQAGYNAQWKPLVEQNKLAGGAQKHIGFQLSLAPNDEAYCTPLH